MSVDPTASRVAFATLGCKLNQFETDSMATTFRAAGYRIVDFADPADVYVVNTCTVTNRADRKSRNLRYRAERARPAQNDSSSRPGPLVVMTGCYVDSHRDELESDGTTWFVDNAQKQSIPDLVEAHFAGEVIHPRGSVFDFPTPDRIFHTRSTVKVQDGCDNYCTFCIIPFVRGHATSRPSDQVLASVREAVNGGSREIVLTGVNMSRYRDQETDFASLIERVLDVEGDWRLRISSLEPDGLTDRFIDLFRHPRMARHLHLCLQSGSQRILLAMRRQYTYGQYRDVADRLRLIDPLFNITTDLIVGFPGETDEEHAASIAAIPANRFGHVHTFPYSVRSGTRAERMPGHHSERVKRNRAHDVRRAADAEKRAYRTRLIGRTERVLVERVDHRANGARLRGFGEHYVQVEVDVPSAGADRFQNTFVDVRIDALHGCDDPPLAGRLA